MDKFDNVYTVHSLLGAAKAPVTKLKLQQSLGCTSDALERIINDMRLYLDAPIKYNAQSKAYYYDEDLKPGYELPGLWFNASELYGLFASYQLLSEVGPGLLESQIAPVKEKLESLMHSDSTREGDLNKRVRILKIAARKPGPKNFSLVATALLMRKQLNIKYAGRDRDTSTERIISPQRLVHYRDNWYIDAWCHMREQLRTFAVDRIEYSRLINTKAIEIDDTILNEHYSTAYGIFSGKPNKVAILKFNKSVAKWIAEEQWHPDQNGQFDFDGCYQLEIPYRDPRELIQDILRFGADVEVLKPPQLREEIRQRINEMALLYS